ncbi:MAG: AAA family ATPase [Actinomycetota bacterium]|nr:AAA family ATPase [Actinomycetota bacterium]
MIETILVDENNKLAAAAKRLGKEPEVKLSIISSLSEAEALVDQQSGLVVVIGPGTPVEAAVSFTERVGRQGRKTGCILIAEKPAADLLRQALRAGFKDVVSPDAQEIIDAVRRVHETIAPPAKAAGDQANRSGRVITFFSTKGGVGKTVFAVNTAVGLAKTGGRRVIILDLDHQFGDVGVMLGLRPERTITDLIPVIDRLDADMLKGFLTNHSSGAQVLLASVRREAAEKITEAQFAKLFAAARQLADFIVVDTPAAFVENTLTVLDHSDCICLVTTLDVPSVKKTQIALQTLQLLGYPEGNIKLLLNRADSKVSLSPTEVEGHLKHKIAVQIPSALHVPRSVNEGAPLIMDNGSRLPVTAALNQIVTLVSSVSSKREQAAPGGKVALSEG